MGLLQSNRTSMNGVASLIGAAASLIPYTKNVTYVGATGVAVAICGTSDGVPLGKPLVISKFADDRPPIQIKDVTVRDVETSTLGHIVRWDVVPKVEVVISVIPCTKDDANLGKLVYSAKEFNIDIYQVRQSDPAASYSVFGIGAAKCKKYGIKLNGGTLVSSPPFGFRGQPQGTAEQGGRWSGHSYSFIFTEWTLIEEEAKAQGFWASLASQFTGNGTI